MRRASILSLSLLLTMSAGCSSTADSGQEASGQAVSTNNEAIANRCEPCASDIDCSGQEVCAQFDGDGFCADPCGSKEACPAGESCTAVTTQSGQEVAACLPAAGACGPSGETIEGDARKGKDAGAPKPDGGTPVDAGPPVTGTIGANGGTLSRLRFAVVGDTRPPAIDDTKGYPSAIASKIFTDLADASPAIPFGVSTGDYQFSTPTGTQASTQLDLYIAARSAYSGVMFPTMGNHECTGATTSNCGSGTADGLTNNYTEFLQKLLTPLAKTTPNYSINVSASDASWTAKLVFIAGNAWTSTAATWLEGVLAQPTTYTFIVRHEPAAATTAPGVKPSEALMKKYPYTLAIVGHTHTYKKSGPKEIIVGNGGAPLTTGNGYGYGLLNQRNDGTIRVDMVDYQSGATDPSFAFAINPDGSPATL